MIKLDKVFLATTGIEDFWDKKEKLVFLGRWCIIGKEKGRYEDLDHEVLPFYFDDRVRLSEAYHYTQQVFNKLLPVFAEGLNEYHSLQEDIRYYNKVLGYWLLHFIHSTYDKYVAIKNAIDTLKDFRTYTLHDDDYYFPEDCGDFENIVTEDAYALQIYSQILNHIGINTEKRHLHISGNAPAGSKLSYRRIRNVLFTQIQLKLNNVLHRERKLAISLPYFGPGSVKRKIEFLLKSRFRYPFTDFERLPGSGHDIDHDFRQRGLPVSGDEFEKLMGSLAPLNIPRIYLEFFSYVVNKARGTEIFRKNGLEYLFTANDHVANDVFRIYCAENKIKILGIQHGNGCNNILLSPHTDYEKSVCDVFYTLGSDANYLPHPLLKIRCSLKRKYRYKLLVMDNG